MKVRFKARKGSGVLTAIVAGIAFIFLAVYRFNFPVEKVIEFLWICVLLVVAIILVAAPVALVIRWWSNRRDD